MTSPDPQTFNAAFHVRLMVLIESELVDLALETIALVWERGINRPQEFKVTFARRAETPDGVEGMGVYDHKDQHFYLTESMFLGTQGEIHDKDARKAMVVSVAAHEAMHAVQHARGEDFEAAPQPGSPDYLSSPLEVEAHQESLLVLRGYCPKINVSLPLGDRYYDVPPTSPYTPMWEELPRLGAKVRVLSRKEG